MRPISSLFTISTYLRTVEEAFLHVSRVNRVKLPLSQASFILFSYTSKPFKYFQLANESWRNLSRLSWKLKNESACLMIFQSRSHSTHQTFQMEEREHGPSLLAAPAFFSVRSGILMRLGKPPSLKSDTYLASVHPDRRQRLPRILPNSHAL